MVAAIFGMDSDSINRRIKQLLSLPLGLVCQHD